MVLDPKIVLVEDMIWRDHILNDFEKHIIGDDSDKSLHLLIFFGNLENYEIYVLSKVRANNYAERGILLYKSS